MVKLLRPSSSKRNNYPEDSIPHATQILYSQLTATEKLQSQRETQKQDYQTQQIRKCTPSYLGLTNNTEVTIAHLLFKP